MQCGPENVEISAKTERPFEGVVYIKDWRRTDGCYTTAGGNSSGLNYEPRLAVPLNDLSRCGMEMKRKVRSLQAVTWHGSWLGSCNNYDPLWEGQVALQRSFLCILPMFHSAILYDYLLLPHK